MKGKINNMRAVWLACLLAVLAAGLAGCPTPAEKSAEMTMVLQGGLAEDIKAGGGELPRETITAVYVVVDEVTLQQTDGSSVTIFKGPFEVDILSLQGIGTVMAAVDIPVGSYTGGVMTLSGAEAELSGEPGVRVPLALPNGGQYAFEDAFTVAADSTGVLKLHLDDIEIYTDGVDTLEFSAAFEFEVETEDPDPDDYLLIGEVTAEGVINGLDLDAWVFELKLNDGGELAVDFAMTAIYLSLDDAKCGTEGTLADLAESACARVTGDLIRENGDLWIVAETVTILGYDCE